MKYLAWLIVLLLTWPLGSRASTYRLGMGGMAGQNSLGNLGGAVLSLEHSNSLDDEKDFSYRYGDSYYSLDIGSGIGAEFLLSEGWQIISLKGKDQWAFPFVGLNPLHTLVQLHSSSNYQSFYEYIPEADIGYEVQWGKFTLTPVLFKLGMAAGDLNNSNIDPQVTNTYGWGSEISSYFFHFYFENLKSPEWQLGIISMDLTTWEGVALGFRREYVRYAFRNPNDERTTISLKVVF